MKEEKFPGERNFPKRGEKNMFMDFFQKTKREEMKNKHHLLSKINKIICICKYSNR